MLAVHHRDVADDVWSVEVAVVDGDHRLRVRGELDFSNAGRFGPVVRAALGAGVRTLDASELVFCDVAGIRALVSAADALPPDALPLMVTGADGVLATMLHLTGALNSRALQMGERETST
jgi:anti-anti-sigma factor